MRYLLDSTTKTNEGKTTFPGEAQLEHRLAVVVLSQDYVVISSTTDAVSNSSYVAVVVTLFVNSSGIPDSGWIQQRGIAAGLKREISVSYETTLPVGITRNRFLKGARRGLGVKI